MTGTRPHSADYLGAWRDHWWHQDFLALIARRCSLSRVKSVLDVGCGIGHWGAALASILPQRARLIGVDREPQWLAQARRRAGKAGLGGRFSFQKASAEALPFPAGSFDLVTCQTLLIHVREPRQVLGEMLRVLKPGGLIMASEPNNLVGASVLSSLSLDEPAALSVARFRFELLCERGKRILGLGNNSVGDLVPGLLAQLGAREIKVYLNDKLTALFAPYAEPGQRAFLKQLRDWFEREVGIGTAEETLRYFLAGGGTRAQFAEHRRRLRRESRTLLAGVEDGSYHCANGHLHYLICARARGSP
jgi:ubiquinone/menaquinone biosynthesis C-methylase UbiE